MTIDPNLVLTLGSLLITGATWLYHKAKGEKHDDISDALGSTVEGYALKLAESDDTIDNIRKKLTTAAEEGLARLGVKRSTVIDFIIAQLVEKGVTEVRKRVLARKQLEAAITAAATQAEAVTDKFTPTGSIPKIGDGLPGEVQVTLVAP